MIHVAARAFGSPLMVEPIKAGIIAEALAPRLFGAQATIDHGGERAGVIDDDVGRFYDRIERKPYAVDRGVAIIGVAGTLVHKGSYVGSSSGVMSYEGIQAQVSRAARDPEVRGVIFDVDSYGGEVDGAFETADMIARLSVEKPTLAILTSHAYSAAYLLASAAREIVAPPTGGAGSIGVVRMHVDQSRLIDGMGVRVTFVHAGAHKVEGNQYEALPREVAERWQGEVETLRAQFAEAVGRYRGSRFSAEEAMATEALTFRAENAATLGLIDATGDYHDAREAFVEALV